MFAQIETKGATHILINIPMQGSDKSLPAIAAMLENNATFINKGWREMSIVKPEMSIVLGESVTLSYDNVETVIKSADSDCVIGESFVLASNEVFTSNAEAVKKMEDRISRLGQELSVMKSQRDELQEKLSSIATYSE